MKKLMPSEGLRLGCSSGSTRCVIAKNYVLGQPGGDKSMINVTYRRKDLSANLQKIEPYKPRSRPVFTGLLNSV